MDGQVKQWVEVVLVKYRACQRKKLKEARNSVCGFLGSSPAYQDPAADILIVDDDIVEENAPWTLCDSMCKDVYELYTVCRRCVGTMI